MKIFTVKGEFLTFGNARGKTGREHTCSWRDEREAWDENTQVEVITWQWIYKGSIFGLLKRSMDTPIEETNEALHSFKSLEFQGL